MTTTIVDKGRAIEATADLSSPAELFAVPAADPFDDAAPATAVVEDLVAHLRSRSLRNSPAITIGLTLPAAQIERNTHAHARAALQRYASRKLVALERDKAAIRFERHSQLPSSVAMVALVFLVTLLVVALFPSIVRPYLVALLTPVATVAIWVALWGPIEMALHDGWTLRRDKAIYALLEKAEVRVTARER